MKSVTRFSLSLLSVCILSSMLAACGGGGGGEGDTKHGKSSQSGNSQPSDGHRKKSLSHRGRFSHAG